MRKLLERGEEGEEGYMGEGFWGFEVKGRERDLREKGEGRGDGVEVVTYECLREGLPVRVLLEVPDVGEESVS